jgi:exodeoxyribonuclease VII large subunit
MMKPVKSGWDFGELFPAEQTRKVWSVTELTWRIRRALEAHVGQVWVTGEITNLRVQGSGHAYFTLKDIGAQLNCVLFRGESKANRSLLQDGRKVVLQGEITVYEPRGQYQLRVLAVELQGVGALQVAFEKLKQKLHAEGLFAQERKRPLPRYPRRIGLVTSPTGAAIRDVLHMVERRNPSLEIILAPSRVQGEGAAPEIAQAIELLNAFSLSMTLPRAATSPDRTVDLALVENRVVLAEPLAPDPATQATGDAPPPLRPYLDLILLTRGGGSLEDLWAFNEEIVARAIYRSALPVVSAVGHEIDFTISDFVADVRAATPSAAAEIITEDVFSSCQFVAGAQARLAQLARQQLQDKEYRLAELRQRMARVRPRRRLDDLLQRLDDRQASLSRCLKHAVLTRRLQFQNLCERLSRVRPQVLLNQRREAFSRTRHRMDEHARHRLGELKSRLETLQARLRLLGPEQVLSRGYSITADAETGRVLRQPTEVQPNQRIRTRLQHGTIFSRAEE